MPQEPEPRHIGASGRPMREQAGGSRTGRLHHRRQRTLDGSRRGEPARIGREDHAGTERLGQDQTVTGAQPALAQELTGARPAGGFLALAPG